MKQIIAIYLLIGLILSPFIHSNNANSHRPSLSRAYSWGQTLGGSIYWPSYLFSIEPEVDGKNMATFQKSIFEIIKYRNEKLFTGQRTSQHGLMIMNSIGSCLIATGFGNKDEIQLIYNNFLSEETDKKDINDIRRKIMDRFDGFDFSDIVNEGEKCKSEWISISLPSSSEGASKVPVIPSERNLSPESTSQRVGTPQQPQQAIFEQSADKAFKAEEIDSLKNYTRKWEAILADPQAFLNKCAAEEAGILLRQGSFKQENAEIMAKSKCSTQLTELKACMDKPNARADHCFMEVFERGD